MRSKSLLLVVSALLLSLPALPLAAAEPVPDLVRPPDSILARHVPDIPRSSTEGLLPYENLRVAWFADWHPSERRILIRTRFGDSTQIHEVAMPMGARTQLTFYKDTVTEGAYRPGRPDQVLISLNERGAENFQLLLVDRATGKAMRLTDGKSRNAGPEWSSDGKLLAYVNNARNGRDFDLYVSDASGPAAERRVAELQGSWSIVDWSPDDKRILVKQEIAPTESYLHWIDAATGEAHAITPRGGEPVDYADAVWAKDGSIYATTDLDGEFLHLVRLDPATGKTTPVPGTTGIKWDVESFDVSDDGSLLAFAINEEGFSRLRFLDLRTGKTLPSPEMPDGVMTRPRFRRGSHEVAFALNWARATRDVYSYDADTRRLERWTASEAGGLNTSTFALPELIRFPTFDGRTIPAFVYRPPADRFPGPRPVYIDIHGGPEEQARPNFLGSNNYFISELGIAVVTPNVRGSSGYGKSYLKLDNGEKREDSVKDIGALLDWIAKQPGFDASRVMVSGGSYGGYMVLASLVHYSDRLCCAFDSVGISDFVTFLESTSDYRRDLRRAEYGDERDPKMREHLLKIAPARNVERIGKPLLVSQGANDPRVPISESDQIVAALEKRGVSVWYLVGKDEGHGFQKKSNSDYQRAVLVRFMETYLLGR